MVACGKSCRPSAPAKLRLFQLIRLELGIGLGLRLNCLREVAVWLSGNALVSINKVTLRDYVVPG